MDIEIWRQALSESLTRFGTTVAEFSGKLLLALLIVFVGWIVARIVRTFLRVSLSRLGADKLVERAGVADGLRRVGIARPLSHILGTVFFWVLVLVFLLLAVDALGLRAVTTTVERFIGYVPHIVGAALILFVGLLAGKILRGAIASGAVFGSADHAARLGQAAHMVVVATAGLLAIEQLGVETQILVATLTALIAAFGLSMGIAFALGARHVVRHVLAGHFLRQRFKPGERLTMDTTEGILLRVGVIDTVLDQGQETISLPNGALLDSTVRRRAEVS